MLRLPNFRSGERADAGSVLFVRQWRRVVERPRWAVARMNTRTQAFTVVEVLVVIALVVLILAMLTPATDNRPTRAPTNECVNHLRQIDFAEQTWALEHNKTTNDTPTWSDLHPYIKTNRMTCPAGGKYALAPIEQGPSCSIPKHQAVFLRLMNASTHQ
jgi:competence protein ComGC